MRKLKSASIAPFRRWRQLGLPALLPKSIAGRPAGIAQGGDCRSRWGRRSKQITCYLVSLLSLTAVHGSRYYNEPQLVAGSRSPQDLYAPESALVEDLEATEAKKTLVGDQLPRALQIDTGVNQLTRQELTDLFAQIDQIRRSARPLPYVSTGILSLTTQIYLQHLSPPQWQELQREVLTTLRSLPQGSPSATVALAPTSDLDATVRLPLDTTVAARQARQELVRAWQVYELDQPSPPVLDQPETHPPLYRQLTQEISTAQRKYQQARTDLQAVTSSQVPVEILDLSVPEWERLQSLGHRALVRLQAIGVAPGLPAETRLRGIQAQIDGALNLSEQSPELRAALESALIGWLDRVLTPNLILDKERDQFQRESAMGTVEPIMIPVSRGALLVRAGEQITPETFLLLDHFGLTQRGINVWGLLGVAGLTGLGIVAFMPLQRRLNPHMGDKDRLLLLLLVLTVAPLASGFGVQFSSLPAVALLSSSFYGTGIGLLVVAGEALILPVVASTGVGTLVPLVVGSLVACLGARRLRSREELALLGGGAALGQMLTQGMLNLSLEGGLDLIQVALAGGTGLGWSIIALGASPYLEKLFDLCTPVRLMEMANPNRPLLRRLATEAPGTFQHTLFVATLAERAAQRLNLNAELVRTGTLYHDIGKMVHAQYFIENQMGGLNPHSQIDDPYRSAQIIKAHISDGLKLARQYRLPMAIQAFIPEHQGTILIAYFYHQAQLKAAGQPVPEMAFRYDGPIPQTKETGVVMLADACEAALRSMGTECLSREAIDEARAMIRRIFDTRWQDGQLCQCGLSQRDLDGVADAFIEVWRQSNHERIPYPKAATTPASPVESTVPALSLGTVVSQPEMVTPRPQR